MLWGLGGGHTDLKMLDSRRQVLAQQSEATEGAAARSAVTANRSASRVTLSDAPRLMTSSGTGLDAPCSASAFLFWSLRPSECSHLSEGVGQTCQVPAEKTCPLRLTH